MEDLHMNYIWNWMLGASLDCHFTLNRRTQLRIVRLVFIELRWSTRGEIPMILGKVISCAVIKHDTCDVDLAFCFENNSEFSKNRL